jgi:hypothetical protein
MGEWMLGMICPTILGATYLFLAVLLVTSPRANSHHWDD